MKNLNNVYDVLKQEKQFLDNDGNIFKNKVCEYARKMDKSLLKLLYNLNCIIKSDKYINKKRHL